MATLMVGFALVTALCTGYQVGRRAGRQPLYKRTSRWDLGKAAANLAVLVIARRCRRSFVAQHVFATVIGARGSAPRQRFGRR